MKEMTFFRPITIKIDICMSVCMLYSEESGACRDIIFDRKIPACLKLCTSYCYHPNTETCLEVNATLDNKPLYILHCRIRKVALYNTFVSP